jgi:hypothetical protein
MKTFVDNDLEFGYLKWLLNNINHVIQLEVHLYYNGIWENHQKIWKTSIDANFIRQHCLPDEIINIREFYFYICAKCELSSNDVERIINSFQTDSFFVLHQWANVKCIYDKHASYQHMFSSNLKRFSFRELSM